jgi:decaprenylphospho-beta-D-erythro-pentofuranosid-2-ulose 2-reductase
MKKILIIGATSAIAEATARELAEAGNSIFLSGRTDSKLQIIAEDLRQRGADNVHTEVLDVLDYGQHESIINAAIEAMKGLDVVLIAHGTLPDQKDCESSFDVARREMEINAISTISLLTHVANYFESQRRGTIAVISSVAGDRGRQSNYLYGSAKGMVTVFLQGLRNRLHRSGVKVVTIKPGFVDTPMTAAFEKGALWATPQQIGKIIAESIDGKKDVVYAPWFWRYIMLVIKTVPEFIFKRLGL